jgi:hypothetical protein
VKRERGVWRRIIALERRLRREYVYLVQAIVDGKLSGPVKIGTTRVPTQRLNQLQTGNPQLLYLRFSIPVERAGWLERFIHQQYAHLRIRGEWFEFSQDIIDWFRLAEKNQHQATRVQLQEALAAEREFVSPGGVDP